MPDLLQRQFTINAALTKAFTRKDASGAEQRYLSGTASSTVRDRQGDTITARGQASMLQKLQTGNNGQPLAMFLNHSYNVPEDVLGTCEESQLSSSAGDDIALDIVCRVASANPRAVMSYELVKSGVPLGYSIGGAITECSVDEEHDDGESWCPPLLIDGIDLFEISLCGIPANPMAYTDAAKALVKDLGLKADAPEASKDWARLMRIGFVRSVTRDKKARAKIREAVPALIEAAIETPAMIALRCTECEWKRDVEASAADEIVREHEDEQAHVVERSEIAPVEKTSDDGDAVPPTLDPDSQAAVAECIGHLSAAMAHGACNEVNDCVGKALERLKGMLAPADADDAADGGQDAANLATEPEVQASAPDIAPYLAALVALKLEPNATIDDVIATLDKMEAAATKAQADLAELTETATQRAADVTAAETKLAEIATATAEAQAKLDELKSTPTGRATATTAGGGRSTASTTMHEAQRNLGAALTGAR